MISYSRVQTKLRLVAAFAEHNKYFVFVSISLFFFIFNSRVVIIISTLIDIHYANKHDEVLLFFVADRNYRFLNILFMNQYRFMESLTRNQ